MLVLCSCMDVYVLKVMNGCCNGSPPGDKKNINQFCTWLARDTSRTIKTPEYRCEDKEDRMTSQCLLILCEGESQCRLIFVYCIEKCGIVQDKCLVTLVVFYLYFKPSLKYLFSLECLHLKQQHLSTKKGMLTNKGCIERYFNIFSFVLTYHVKLNLAFARSGNTVHSKSI